MSMISFAAIYKDMSADDRGALAALKAEKEKRVGRTLTTREVLEAVTPGFPDPAYLSAA